MMKPKALAVMTISLALALSSAALADVFVDHENGSDENDGSVAVAAGDARGPVATLRHALEIRKPADRIVLRKTNAPYRESIVLTGLGGEPGQSLVIEGNGAVLDGLTTSKPDEWREEPDGSISVDWGADWGFCVVADGKLAERAESRESMKPGQSFGDYVNHRGYYLPAAGQSTQRTRLELPRGYCGVSIWDASHITIRNLTCQFFWNDGFNIQGDAQDIRFESVVGRFNGDEGISAHGTADVTVVGADLYGNDNGLYDTVLSRTRYIAINVHDNRSIGVGFQGGDHTITDARIENNPAGIVMEEGQGPVYLPGFSTNPDIDCRLTLRNVLVNGGSFGIKLAHHSSLSLEHVTIIDQPIGISLVGERTFAHVVNSIIASSQSSLEGNGRYWGDYNCWKNPRASINGEAKDLKDWAHQLGADEHSLFADPQLDSSGAAAAASPIIGKAYVDEIHYEALRGSSELWNPAHPPRVLRDMGFDATTATTSSPGSANP